MGRSSAADRYAITTASLTTMVTSPASDRLHVSSAPPLRHARCPAASRARKERAQHQTQHRSAHTVSRRPDSMLNQPRLDEILRHLSQQQRVKSLDLATSFGVSEETIRRDFKFLEGLGKLRRVHGGAILPRLNEEQPLQVRNRIKTQAKVALAACAAQLVQDGMAVFLDTGTTTLALAQRLTEFKRLRVVTNSLDIAQLIAHHSDNDVVVTPGDLRRNDNALIGPHTLEFAGQFHYDIAFMGIGGIDL